MNLKYIICLGSLLIFGACGDNDDDNDDNPTPQEETAQNAKGQYRVNLKALNETYAGNTSGIGFIKVQDDEFSVTLGGSNIVRKETGHTIHIHSLGACPTTDNDVNSDKVIDSVEAAPVFGQDLIPLDSDLNDQEAGIEEIYRSNDLGILSYNESGVFSQMLANLREADPDPTDSLEKLSTGEELNLEGRTMVIHGMPDNKTLPNTVSSETGTEAVNTLPIACGVIQRIIF